jgi:putative ABC transport system substrate-binding protein
MAARAQQRERMRRIGVLMNLAADDEEGQARLAAFLQGLQESGWSVGRNVRIDVRWGGGNVERYHTLAEELVALAPEIILAGGSAPAAALLRVTRGVPIVFAQTTDPVTVGLVASLSRPGGNVTGFTQFEYGVSVKWLELLKQIVPSIRRVGVVRDPGLGNGVAQLAAIQAVAPSFGVEVFSVRGRDANEIEDVITAFARGSDSGLIVVTGGFAITHRERIIAMAARHRLPAVYSNRLYVTSGGLISYAPDSIDPFRRAAGYVDRILKGEKPADLPVQAPTKYELVLNMKTAKALGIELPAGLLALADEVIE